MARSSPQSARLALPMPILSFHRISPVILSTQKKLGAFGAGTLLCPQSTPLDVQQYSLLPSIITEQLLALCGNTPIASIMSSRQMMSAPSGSVETFSSSAGSLVLRPSGSAQYWPSYLNGPRLPLAKPSVLRQSSSQRLVTQ